jgi:hypothetical protein
MVVLGIVILGMVVLGTVGVPEGLYFASSRPRTWEIFSAKNTGSLYI